ncbi:MAG: hypothetical protein ACR650_09730 [Methylocystis sp.]
MTMKDVRAAVSRAKPANGRRLERAQIEDPPLGCPIRVGETEIFPGEWTPDALGLPQEHPCPVAPLGVDERTLYLQDALGQFVETPRGEMGRLLIMSWFGERQDYLPWAWPAYSRRAKRGEPNIVGWAPEDVQAAIIRAASRLGPFNPLDKVRGLGAWRGRDGELIWNAGPVLYRTSQKRKTRHGDEYKPQPTGLVEGKFYTRRHDILEPWPEALTSRESPAGEVLRWLKTWNWERPDIDPVLFFGWLCAALIGGALDWRPAVFVIAARGTGKSTLQELVGSVLGEAMVKTADATAASIYQHVRNDSVAVCVDELEGEADNRKTMGVVKQARLAASGGLILRGGANGVGTEFKARSCFFFSAINPPPLEPQDHSRMAILRLRPLPPDVKTPPALSETVGPMLLRRMMDGWAGLPETLAAYQAVLRRGGHDKRGQDTFGTLLACAEIALGAETMDAMGVPGLWDDGADWWGRVLPPPEDMTDNWRQCLEYLLTCPVEAWRGQTRQTVGRVLRDLEELQQSQVGADGELFEDENSEGFAFLKARDMLQNVGLGLLPKGKHAPMSDGWILAVPPNSSALAKLFRDSKWAGAAGVGGWDNALRQGPEEIVWRGDGARKCNRLYINGVQSRCTLVRMGAFWTMGDE